MNFYARESSGLIRYIGLALIGVLIIGCSTPTRAPVIERMPGGKTTAADWRPDLYTVKKGDTLYSMAWNLVMITRKSPAPTISRHPTPSRSANSSN